MFQRSNNSKDIIISRKHKNIMKKIYHETLSIKKQDNADILCNYYTETLLSNFKYVAYAARILYGVHSLDGQ